MKTICPSGYHHNVFMATHALGHMMHSFHDYIYIYVMPIRIVKSSSRINVYNTFVYECKT